MYLVPDKQLNLIQILPWKFTTVLLSKSALIACFVLAAKASPQSRGFHNHHQLKQSDLIRKTNPRYAVNEFIPKSLKPRHEKDVNEIFHSDHIRSHDGKTWYLNQFDGTANSGVWSDWQPWSDCQTTCGSGYRVRERWCNNPLSSEGSKDCDGPSMEKDPCKIKVHCPQNGGWGAWTPWHCSVTCGGGIASRSRLCDSPPAIYGGICEGNGTEIRDALCNIFTCPPTRKVSNDLLVSEHIVKEGTTISKIFCGTKQLLDNLIWELKTDFRKAVTWVKNGEAWKEDRSRIDKLTTALNFKRAAANDTGFYSCELDLLGGGRRILKAFSLIVTSNKTNIDMQAGQLMEMDCNAMVLGTLYPNARLSWYFNDTLYQSFNETPAVLSNTLKFPFVTLNMTGPWECRTYELDIKETEELKKRKGLLGKLKDKVFKSKEDEEAERKEVEAKKKKQGPAILRPLFKHVSTPAPKPNVVAGRIWVTNRLNVRVNPPKSVAEMLRTPQFMGLCVGVVILALIITFGLLKGKASDMMTKAQGNLTKLDEKKQQDGSSIDDPAKYHNGRDRGKKGSVQISPETQTALKRPVNDQLLIEL